MTSKTKKGYLQPPVNPHNEPYVDGLNSMLESLYDHDDRSVVLNMAAFAEDTLELLLLAYLREPKHAKELVIGFNAPLGTFSARIKAALVLGLVRKDSYQTLEILRKIRNKFAHDWEGVSLDRNDMASLIAQLSPSRIDSLQDNAVEQPILADRNRLINKFSDVLIDLRMLAKMLTKNGKRTPLIMGDGKPVRVKLVMADELTGE